MTKLRILIVLSIISIASVFISAQGRGEGPERMVDPYKIGDKAADFRLSDTGGNLVSLADFENAKGYIVIFTSNVCPFALAYEDRIIALHKKMEPLGYPVIAINSNDGEIEEGDSFTNMQIRAKEKQFPFHYLDDKDQMIYPKFGATKTPHVFILDASLTVQYIGAIDDNSKDESAVTKHFVEDAITALENGKLPVPNFTKAVGCPIKSKSNGNEDGKDRKGRKGPPNPKKMMERMDTDKDGKISKSEVNGRMANDFDRIDEDGDGFLTLEELANAKPPKRKRN